MNILQIHKHFFRRDGASTYFLNVSELLSTHQHTVVPFAMHHRQNESSEYSRYFVSQVDFRQSEGPMRTLRKAGRFVYSTEARRKLESLISAVGPFDVAHVHNIYHHLTPSILPVLKKHHIPVVMSLHDYKLVSADYSLTAKRSVAHKALGGLERMLHQLLRSYDQGVDLFLAPSQFMMDFCIKAGWPKERFVHLPYTVDTNAFVFSQHDDGYVAYAGRLSHEKGLELLVAVAARLPHVQFRIAGRGPLESKLEATIKHKSLNNVELLGFLKKDKLIEFISRAGVVVVPSTWSENYPFAVLEAQAMGKVVVASRVGGIPEQIAHGKTGFLVQPNNTHAWIDMLDQVQQLPSTTKDAISLAAREWVVSQHNLELHYERLMKVYEYVIAS